MNKLFQAFQSKSSGILNVYFTAGYPQLNDTSNIIKLLDDCEVDIIEVGLPYSDPLADGLTIQKSSNQALKNGIRLNTIFKQIGEARTVSNIPIVLMGYYNQLLQYGIDKFLKNCLEVGIDGLIIPDLPFDYYERNYKLQLEQMGIAISFLITPETSEDRIRKIDELSSGFVYIVSNSSTTGGKRIIAEDSISYFKRIEAMKLSSPRLIGFGSMPMEQLLVVNLYDKLRRLWMKSK
jgi:tryptophan synthase alpha chain